MPYQKMGGRTIQHDGKVIGWIVREMNGPNFKAKADTTPAELDHFYNKVIQVLNQETVVGNMLEMLYRVDALFDSKPTVASKTMKNNLRLIIERAEAEGIVKCS